MKSMSTAVLVLVLAAVGVSRAEESPLKLHTTYAPPQHPPGTVHHTKADAQRAEESESPPKGE